MKLIPRRKKSPHAVERVAGLVKLGAHGLTAQRLARRGHKGYKVTRRVAPLAGLAAIGAVVAKKLSGRRESEPAYTPPPSTGPAAGTTGTAAATAGTGTPPVEPTASGSDIPEALADAGVAGDGPDTPEEAGAKDVPPADASGTEEALDVEAPNQSTPPPPEKAKNS